MWIIRWILTLLAVAFLIGFAMQNADVHVPIRFYRWETINDLPLWLVMYVSFIAGMIFWFFVSLFQILGLKTAQRRYVRRIRSLENELKSLRNAAVEEVLAPESIDETKAEPTRGQST